MGGEGIMSLIGMSRFLLLFRRECHQDLRWVKEEGEVGLKTITTAWM
jgi:hypothetical protein